MRPVLTCAVLLLVPSLSFAQTEEMIEDVQARLESGGEPLADPGVKIVRPLGPDRVVLCHGGLVRRAGEFRNGAPRRPPSSVSARKLWSTPRASAGEDWRLSHPIADTTLPFQ